MRDRWALGLGVVVASTLLILWSTAATSAVAVSYTTRLGTHGAAKLTVGGPNKLYVSLRGLSDGRWAEAIYAGTCARLGRRVVALPALVVNAGTVKRTNSLTASQARAARTGVIRVAKGTTRYCAPFLQPTPPRPTPTPTPPRYTPTPSPTPTPTSTATSTPTGTSASNACPCVGDTLRVYFTDGSEGTVGVTQVNRTAAPTAGFTILDVRVRVTGPAGEDIRFDYQVRDNGGATTRYSAEGGAPAPAYPDTIGANGIGEGWLRFTIPSSYQPYLVNPGGADISLA